MQVTNEIAGALAFADRSHNHSNAIGNFKIAQNFAESVAFFRIFDLARDSTAIAERHQHKVASGEAEICGHARPLGSNWTFCYLHNHLRTDRINFGNIFGGDSFSRPLVPGPVDLLDPTVERGGNRVPEVKKCVFFEADVHEHRLQTDLDVFNFPFVDAPSDVAGAGALDVVLLKLPVFEECDSTFELFDADD